MAEQPTQEPSLDATLMSVHGEIDPGSSAVVMASANPTSSSFNAIDFLTLLKNKDPDSRDVVIVSRAEPEIQVSTKRIDGLSRLVSIASIPVAKLAQKVLVAVCSHYGIQGYSWKSKPNRCACNLRATKLISSVRLSINK